MPMSSVATRVEANAINNQFVKIFAGTGVWDVASAATGASSNDTIAIPGVALGDVVLGVSSSVAVPAGAALVGDVTAANTVTVKLINNSGGAVDLASATYRVVVGRMASFPPAVA